MTLDSQEDVDFSDSRYFQVVVNHLIILWKPWICVHKDEYHGLDDIKGLLRRRICAYDPQPAKTENTQFINDVVWHSERISEVSFQG